MAVTSKDIRTRLVYVPQWQERTILVQRSLAIGMSVLAVLLAMMATYLIIGTLLGWGQVWFDDFWYGRPRTMHLTGFVGHDEANGQPSHFVGLNLNRQVVVLQFPGGNVDEVRTLHGPYLFGKGEDLTPVHIALEHMDQDTNVDLVVTVRNEQIIYLNKNGEFRLPTGREQQQLLQLQGG